MKLFEQYLSTEEIMEHLRKAAKRIVQNLKALPKELGAEIALDDNCRIMIKRIRSLKNDIAFLEIEVYRDNMYIGNIQLDFKSEAPYILVAYEMSHRNEGLNCGQPMKILND